MLQRAAATVGRMWAWRDSPIRAGCHQPIDLGGKALGALPGRARANDFAGQHAAQEQIRAVVERGDAVAFGTDAGDANVARRRQVPAGQAPNAESPVCARPRISACTSCVPS